MGLMGKGGGWVKVEIKAISAQPTEVGVRLSWAELGNFLSLQISKIVRCTAHAGSYSLRLHAYKFNLIH